MDSNAGGWAGAKIDYGGANPAEVLMQGAALKDRRKERQDELAMQKMRFQKEDDDKKYAWAQGATDPSKYVSGQTAIDQHAQGALGEVMHNILNDPNFHSENLGQLMSRYLPAIQSVAAGHLVGKQLLDKGYKQIEDASKDNPNLNTAALKQHLFDQVGQSVLDQEGNYRAPDQIDTNRDIVGSVLESPDAWQFSNGASKLINNLRTLKGDKVNAITQQPNGTIVTHEGYLTPFQQQDWSVQPNGYSNKLPQFSLKTQPVTLPDGKVAQVLDDKVFEENFGEAASKEDQMQFKYLWNSYKQHAGLQTTPQSEDYAKRMFAAQLVKDNVQNQMQQVHAEHLPKQGNTTINMGDKHPSYDLFGNTRQKSLVDRFGYERPRGNLPLNEADAAFSRQVLDYLNKSYGQFENRQTDKDGLTSRAEKRDWGLGDALVHFENDGAHIINAHNGKDMGVLTKADVNFAANSAKGDEVRTYKGDTKLPKEQQAIPKHPTETKNTSKKKIPGY
jgi:hypothetical protein